MLSPDKAILAVAGALGEGVAWLVTHPSTFVLVGVALTVALIGLGLVGPLDWWDLRGRV